MSIIPGDAAEILVFVLGVVLGAVLTLAGWRTRAKGSKPLKDPRYKTLLWGFGGLLAILMGEWQFLSDRSEFDRVEVVAFYVAGFTIGLIIVLSLSSIGILIATHRTQRRKPNSYTSQLTRPLLDFLFYGYEYYEEKSKAVELETELSRTTNTNLAALITIVAGYLEKREPTAKTLICKHILDRVCSVATPYLSSGEDFSINSNYMLAIPFAAATPEDKALMMFAWGDPGRYSHLLVLREYARPGSTAPALSLPVESRGNPDWEKAILPGAPEAFVRRAPLLVGSAVNFGEDVPEGTQVAIREYLSTQNFRLFISLPIPVERDTGDHVGIVNIETNHIGFMDAPAGQQEEMVEKLSPFVTLLGLVLLTE